LTSRSIPPLKGRGQLTGGKGVPRAEPSSEKGLKKKKKKKKAKEGNAESNGRRVPIRKQEGQRVRTGKGARKQY